MQSTSSGNPSKAQARRFQVARDREAKRLMLTALQMAELIWACCRDAGSRKALKALHREVKPKKLAQQP
jgi:hypothetical protein